MKQLQIELKNKQKLLLVEVLNKADTDSLSAIQDVLDMCNMVIGALENKWETLGTYSPRTGEIDFDVKEEWVESKTLRSLDGNGLMMRMTVFKDYSETEFVKFYHFRKSSFESLLKSETEKAFPLKENPIWRKPERIIPFKHAGFYTDRDKYAIENYTRDKKIWEESEPKVMPEKFIVLLIK